MSELAVKEDEANNNLVLAQVELQLLQSADDRERQKLADIRNAQAETETSWNDKKRKFLVMHTKK